MQCIIKLKLKNTTTYYYNFITFIAFNYLALFQLNTIYESYLEQSNYCGK